MPVYNAEKYVGEAIESILNQTFADFEFLIFNDGSTDKSAKIIQSYAEKDKRIVFYDYQKNTGLVDMLNKGIDKSQGKYIARMDADDISLPQRFEKQVSFMEKNEDIGVCGTWFTVFENHVENILNTIKQPEQDSDIKIAILHYCPLGHPTIMAKTSLFKNNLYDQDFYPAEDYELWARLIPITKFHNIQESLLLYRSHEANISKNKSETQQNNGFTAQIKQLTQLGVQENTYRKEDIKILFPLHSFGLKNPTKKTAQEMIRLATILQKMYWANRKTQLYDSSKFDAFLTTAWQYQLPSALLSYNISLLSTCLFLPIPTLSLFSWKEKIKFVIKCCLHWKTRI